MTVPQHSVEALKSYLDTLDAATIAAIELRTAGNSNDLTKIEKLFHEARRAAHLHAAACLAIGLDPVVTHPLVEREILKQIEDASLSRVKPKKRTTKNANC